MSDEVASNVTHLAAPCAFEIGDIVRLSACKFEMNVAEISRVKSKTIVTVSWMTESGEWCEAQHDARLLKLAKKASEA